MMVFSFFKKPPEKMPTRKAAAPRAPTPSPTPPRPPNPRPEVRVSPPVIEEIEPLSEPLPDLEFTTSNIKPAFAGAPEPAAAKRPPDPDDLDFTDEEFERDFTESSVMAIDVDDGGDPVQAEIEQVVVLFANSQDKAARSLLEALVRTYHGVEGRRFWMLLFDLVQANGDRAAYDKLCVEFAESCLTSPPLWRAEQQEVVTHEPGVKVFVLQGVLTAEGAQPVTELSNLLGQKLPIAVDIGKLVGCDDIVAGQLADILQRARRGKQSLTIDHADALIKRLGERLVAGQAKSEPSWLLLLELLQRAGTQEAFEEKAVDYAVTFELSPPSWEAMPKPAVKAKTAESSQRNDAYYLSGEIRNSKFEELVDVIESQGQNVLDFSGVRRLDFASAGQLVNRLAPYKKAGREIVIRSPNHLVAELLAVVGVNKLARIIVPKS